MVEARNTSFQLADEYVARAAALDPVAASLRGLVGFEHQLTDYSPDGLSGRVELDRTTLRTAENLDADGDERSRVTREFLTERLGVQLALHEAGETLRSLNVLASPPQLVRRAFDLMATTDAQGWEAVADRLHQVPAALQGWRESLQLGVSQGTVAARRQALAVADQALAWGGDGGTSFFDGLVGRRSADLAPALHTRLEEGAGVAADAYRQVGQWLRDDYARAAAATDGVGARRYALAAQAYNGIELDLGETYAWGWDELRRIRDEMAVVADRIHPGARVEEAVERLERDPDRVIEGEDRLRDWLQDLMDRTITELNGVHFDIPEPVQRVEAMIAPPGGAAAMYYTPPAEDFSRPGRTWYPTQGRTRFPLWGEVSIAYHEGVPGHHLQLGQVAYRSDLLSRFQRTTIVSGHAEGWALYAEQLMLELGFLQDPGHHLGMLRAQALRAARVVVDIGLHLGLAIPDDEPDIGGRTWTPELAHPFLVQHSLFPREFLASEVDRYLGLPGQAISYKVGEREWLTARAEARATLGSDFDLKRFHATALDLGPMGLDQLRRELARLAASAAGQ